LVTADGSHKQENDAGGREQGKNLPITRARKINLEGERSCRAERATFPAPVEQSAQKSDKQPSEKKERSYDIAEDAYIWVSMTCKQINRE